MTSACSTRNLRDVTPAVPEVVAAVRQLAAREAILDGEVIALRSDGAPHPFQVTMQRFGRKLEIEKMRADIPLTPFFFDCSTPMASRSIDMLTGIARGAAAVIAPSMVVPIVLRPTHRTRATIPR